MADFIFTDTVFYKRKNVETLIAWLINQGKLAPGSTVNDVIADFSKSNEIGTYTWKDLYKFVQGFYTTVVHEPTEDEVIESYEALDVNPAEDVNDGLKEVSQTIWSGFTEKVQEVADNIEIKLQKKLGIFENEYFYNLLDKLIELKVIDEETKKGIGSLISVFGQRAFFIAGLLILGLIKTFIAIFISATSGTLTKKLNSEHTPNTPNPESVLRAAFLDPKMQGEVRRVMAENGLSKDDQDLMFVANYAVFDIGTVKDLFLRGFITDSEVKKYLDDLGFTPERQKLIGNLFEMLIPIQDVATWMSKEAFEEDQISIMGLDRELPQLFIDYAAKHGISSEDARRYWIAHWNQPGLDLMYRALHRRLISPEQLQTHMRTLEIPPYLRQVMTDIAYTPLTRVDIRRMYEDGVLNLEEVYNAYLDHGYNETNAALMTTWTQRYAEPNEKELTRSQIINLYIDGQLSRADTVSMLSRIGYPEHRAELIVVYAEYQEIKDLQNEQLANVELLYKENWIDKTAARQEMGRLELSPERISILIQKKTVATKMPSKTDFDKFLRNEIINETTYFKEMQKLGYSQRYIDMYFKLVKKGIEESAE
jgi:hypothetical protein